MAIFHSYVSFPRTSFRFPGETIEVHHATLHRIGDLLFPGTLAGNQLAIAGIYTVNQYSWFIIALVTLLMLLITCYLFPYDNYHIIVTLPWRERERERGRKRPYRWLMVVYHCLISVTLTSLYYDNCYIIYLPCQSTPVLHLTQALTSFSQVGGDQAPSHPNGGPAQAVKYRVVNLRLGSGTLCRGCRSRRKWG